MRRSRIGTSTLTLAPMRDLCSFVGTIAFAEIAAAGPITRLGARIEDLLTTVAAEVALSAPIASVLAVFDSRLPPVAAAGDRMGRPIPGRGDVDVVAAAA
ncbi:MAG TPA: hypothetical protein VER26_12015, partial [Xanthobacteraceae bacterium]|nr:hypothetical protein [Xanthobacteraceae bacterium]